MPTSLQIPLSEKQTAAWRDRIDAGKKYIEKYKEQWREQQAAYRGKPLKDLPPEDYVAVNKDMPRVKQKTAQLFYQVPKLHAKPTRPEYRQAAYVQGAVVNHKLTRVIHVERVVDEVLTDVVAVSGIGVCKVGYEIVTRDVEEPDPAVLPEEVAEYQSQGKPVPTVKVPVPIYDEYYVRRVSPAKLILPPEFSGTDFDSASYIGISYRVPYELAKRLYKVDEAEATTTDDRTVTDDTVASEERVQKDVELTEIWYWAALFDRKESHPLKQRRLVFLEGTDEPVVHEDSPYQRFTEDGRYQIGMRKYPIRVLALTVVPDEAIPPSDTQISRPLVNELQMGRSQMIKQRRRAVPLRWYNTSLVDPDTAEKILNGEIQDIIPLSSPGDSAIGEIARANYPRETFEFQRVIESDLMEAWALGSNQMGQDSPGEVSASEAKIIQGNTNVRLDYERNKVLRWFLDIAELVSDLVQLFADEQDYVEVVGQDLTKQMVAWDKTTVAGEFVFEAQTNSQLRLDVAQERMDARASYQLLANEPFANRQALVERIAETHDMDPSRFLSQPPPKQPEAPNVSFRFSGDDLNPMNPAFPIVAHVLASGGFQIPPEVIQEAKTAAALTTLGGNPAMAPGGASASQAPPETEHGGPAEQAEPLSKKGMVGNGDYR